MFEISDLLRVNCRFLTSENDPLNRLRASGKVFRLGDEGPVCFVRAVTFGPFPKGVFDGEEIRNQLEKVRDDLGANAVRFYEPPPMSWLNDCADLGLMAFISIPWSQHVDFLNQKQIRRETENKVRDVVRRYRGHPAVAAYYVGNEIEKTLVRYLGPRRVVRFLEKLIEIGRQQDPEAMFSYANYPSTEFLIPDNQDFLAFNIYLEDDQSLEKYLDRLQALAGNHPLLISEFGIDSERNGEGKQARVLSQHIPTACRAGVAGTTIFSWSDHWERGGETIDDWSFGLRNREDHAKPAFASVAATWKGIEKPFDGVTLENRPTFSIIVCTYKGSLTLPAVLHSLENIDYPSYEVIVVNDGNDAAVREVVQPLDEIRHLGIPHNGLSHARNIGAKTAKGDILVYTDDDCILESDWLNWLALAFDSPERPDCVGGPNIPPPAPDFEQACVIAAPGGPSHVLISDREAEHVPGCNLAVKKHVFDAVGGFNEIFRVAGDDVDFCWRLRDAGFKIGFHAAAFVWHLRRATYKAYFRQQRGYGYAEALLKKIHPEKFGDLGGAVWNGIVYEGPILGFARSGEPIHHGRFGYNAFQLIYPDATGGYVGVFTHCAYLLILLLLVPLGIFSPWFLVVAGVGFLLTLIVVVKVAFQSWVQWGFDSLYSRIVLVLLILWQGFSRSFVRMFRSLRFLRPIGFLKGVGLGILSLKWPRPSTETVYKFWDEEGKGRDELLECLLADTPGWKVDKSGLVDFKTSSTIFFSTDLVSVSEYHGKEQLLTRAMVRHRLRRDTFAIATIGIAAIGNLISYPWWLPVGLGALILLEWIILSIKTGKNVLRAAAKLGLRLAKKRS